jgi:hypothetical protein
VDPNVIPILDSDLYDTNFAIRFLKKRDDRSDVVSSNATVHEATLEQAQTPGTNVHFYLEFAPLNKFYNSDDNTLAKLPRKKTGG